VPLTVVLQLGITPWFGLHHQRDLGSAQSLDLIVVLDGGSSRLAAAERLCQQIILGDPQRGLPHEPNLLLIRWPRGSPVQKPMQELLQGYDTATQITALADWLRRSQAQPPQRIWIATDPEHTARATLLARIALAGRGIQIQPDPPPPPGPGERRKLVRDALRMSLWRATGSTGGWLVPQAVARKRLQCGL
jgi:hypothetical protein